MLRRRCLTVKRTKLVLPSTTNVVVSQWPVVTTRSSVDGAVNALNNAACVNNEDYEKINFKKSRTDLRSLFVLCIRFSHLATAFLTNWTDSKFWSSKFEQKNRHCCKFKLGTLQFGYSEYPKLAGYSSIEGLTLRIQRVQTVKRHFTMPNSHTADHSKLVRMIQTPNFRAIQAKRTRSLTDQMRRAVRPQRGSLA